MINAMYGINLTVTDILVLGQEILRVEHEFNEKAGFTKVDNRLPEFFYKEELPPHSTKFDIVEELDEVTWKVQ
jgi:aldehyde:ferredoxin oxidoreductase